ncbi:Phosphorylated carbohydrates phosphatase [Shimia sp. SK013]|uniref:HAD family hydrolase n=1 Tax=Shimia sp. SK013 TaxID=1389006 RepID=UPI0006B4A34D|nr:HAD family phosphatase [Shimia sp. SK013]KPA22617.1 Phosphorylated carbohydrates phosphatase [Shimia sp. SK013]
MTLNIAAEGFLFDMDGLLLDTERLFLRAFLTMTTDLGIAAAKAEAFFVTLVGTSSAVTTSRLSAFLPEGVDIAEFDAEWRDLHLQNVAQGVPLKPHAREIVDAIKARGLPVAVVTSTRAQPARHHLEQAELWSLFDAVIAGDEVTANKPDPEPYLAGARRLGLAASSCIAFEDSDLGTTAAVRAGCHTFQIPDLRSADVPLPDLGQTIARDLGQAGEDIGLLDGCLRK